MHLTISTSRPSADVPATDLGYLLHKHPDRVQEFRQSFGTAPEIAHRLFEPGPPTQMGVFRRA